MVDQYLVATVYKELCLLLGKEEGEFAIDVSLVGIEEESIGMMYSQAFKTFIRSHVSKFRRSYNLNILLFIFFLEVLFK